MLLTKEEKAMFVSAMGKALTRQLEPTKISRFVETENLGISSSTVSLLPPTIEDITLVIAEDQPIGTVIGQLIIGNPELPISSMVITNGHPDYSSITGIAINTYGVIIVNNVMLYDNPLPYWLGATVYTYIVEATNPFGTTTFNVTIQLTDIANTTLPTVGPQIDLGLTENLAPGPVGFDMATITGFTGGGYGAFSITKDSSEIWDYLDIEYPNLPVYTQHKIEFKALVTDYDGLGASWTDNGDDTKTLVGNYLVTNLLGSTPGPVQLTVTKAAVMVNNTHEFQFDSNLSGNNGRDIVVNNNNWGDQVLAYNVIDNDTMLSITGGGNLKVDVDFEIEVIQGYTSGPYAHNNISMYSGNFFLTSIKADGTVIIIYTSSDWSNSYTINYTNPSPITPGDRFHFLIEITPVGQLDNVYIDGVQLPTVDTASPVKVLGVATLLMLSGSSSWGSLDFSSSPAVPKYDI